MSRPSGFDHKLTWNYISRRTTGGINISLGLTQNSDRLGVTGRLSYIGYLLTNKTGHFVFEGLQPAEYELCLFSNQAKIRFEIPCNKTGIYDIGKLKLMISTNNTYF